MEGYVMNERITLTVHKTKNKPSGRIIRINAAANDALMALCRATGLPMGHVASQLLIQGADLVDIIEEEE